MSPQKKAVWVGLILVAGILLALPFRRTTPPADLSSENLAANKIWLQKPVWDTESDTDEAQITETGLPTTTGSDPSTTSQPALPRNLYPDETSLPERTDSQRADNLELIQRRPENPWPATLGSELTELPPDVVVVEKPANQFARPNGSSESPSNPRTNRPPQSPTAPRQSSKRSRQTIKHTVRDGDTLQSLAQRYLRDSRRALEIFNANRARLQNPEALPIGDELIIIVD